MSFYHLPHPWNPGYALPKYIQAEPPGRGTFTTKWLPRGTISQLIPDYLAKPTGRADTQLACDAELGSLGCDSLGAQETLYQLEPLGAIGAGADPIKAYGERAAEWIMRTIYEVEPEDRTIALRALLDTVDKTLWDRVAKESAKFKAKGLGSRPALQKAIALCMANGMMAELVKTGEKIMQKKAVDPAQLQALGFCGPICAAKKVGSAAKSMGKGIGRAGSWVGGKAWSGAKSATNWVGKGISKLGGLACSVANSPIAPIAAGAGAAAMGAPPQAGAMGVSAAGSLCGSKGDSAAAQQQLQTPTPGAPLPSWVLPAAIGGGALVLVLVLRK
ncbi:MAG: hypothetical protein KJO40_13585 [Deltaproteobacteria bacterium]|nr:hypothetical protein [Deltaproteobacteria bacterium]